MKPVGGGLLLAVGALVLLAIWPATLWATYPGHNGRIAYDTAGSEIFTISPTADDPIRLTNGRFDDGSPSWSADGRRITFVRRGRNYSAVRAMRSDGGHEHSVVGTRKLHYDDPDFSPGGGHIVFASNYRRDYWISAVRSDGTHLRQLIHGRLGGPRYSPDGKRIAFYGVPVHRNGSSSIWTIHRDGSHLRRLTRPLDFGVDTNPDWRPDGRRILYTHCDYEERGCVSGDYLYSIRPDGSNRHRVSYTDHPAVYSPAGDRIALSFVQWDTIRQNVFCGDVYTISVAGADRQPDTNYCDGNPQRFTGIASSPSWQPLPGG
ncbi:MAG: TolB family protein [Solirubrobacterales bacterium]